MIAHAAPPAPVLTVPPVSYGRIAVGIGDGTRRIEVQSDGRITHRRAVPGGPRRLSVPVPPGVRPVRVRAIGRGGARWSATVTVRALPPSARRAGRVLAWRSTPTTPRPTRVLAALGGGSGDAGAASLTDTLGDLGLTRSLVRRPYIAPRAVRAEVLARLIDGRDRTKLVAGVPDTVPVAHKSGYTEEVKHDAGILYLRRGPVVAVVMTWSASGVPRRGGQPPHRRRRRRGAPPAGARGVVRRPAADVRPRRRVAFAPATTGGREWRRRAGTGIRRVTAGCATGTGPPGRST